MPISDPRDRFLYPTLTMDSNYILSVYTISVFLLMLLKHVYCYCCLSYDVASESEITPCNKIDKPLVVYRFMGNIMTSIITNL